MLLIQCSLSHHLKLSTTLVGFNGDQNELTLAIFSYLSGNDTSTQNSKCISSLHDDKEILKICTRK
jgi:hypothetical protein